MRTLAALLVVVVSTSWAVDPVCELDTAADSGLQRQLQSVLSELELDDDARDGDLAVALLILTDPDHPRLAQVNGHKMMYAASLPKIAILLGAAVAIDEQRLQLSDKLREDLHAMIRYSCNACATRVLREVGRDRLLETLKSPRYQFYDPLSNGGLWVGKEYSPAVAYRRDPLFGLSHGATAWQVARFYCGLKLGTLASPEQSRLMREVMIKPGIEHKFMRGLKAYPDLRVYRKSGTWRSYHSDSVLVEFGDQTYVMVALAKNRRANDWLEALSGPLHRLAAGLSKTAPGSPP